MASTVRIEITDTETPVLLGTDNHMIIQNVTANDILWAVDALSDAKFTLKKSDSIVIDYDVYLSSDGHGEEYVIVGRV